MVKMWDEIDRGWGLEVKREQGGTKKGMISEFQIDEKKKCIILTDDFNLVLT